MKHVCLYSTVISKFTLCKYVNSATNGSLLCIFNRYLHFQTMENLRMKEPHNLDKVRYKILFHLHFYCILNISRQAYDLANKRVIEYYLLYRRGWKLLCCLKMCENTNDINLYVALKAKYHKINNCCFFFSFFINS